MREVNCKCLECENNKDGLCTYSLGITIGSDGICEDYFGD